MSCPVCGDITENSQTVLHCGPDCHLLQMHKSSPFLPRTHVRDEHGAKDDEYVKRLTESLYAKLLPQQYRILKILPGRKRSPLKCRLLRATLTSIDGARLDEENDQHSLVEYDALSYCWGTSERTCSVICNNLKVPITPHLKNALCSLRYRRRVRYVWNDALCINQLGNIEEKGEQIQLMFTIFRKARKVVGWLGSSKERCEHEDLFACLHLNPARCLPGGSEPHESNWLYSQAGNPVCDCALTSLKWSAFKLVQQNQWFKRTWIRQEIFAAKKVEMRYGPYYFDLQALIQLTRLIVDAHSRDLQLFYALVNRHHAYAVSRSENHNKAKSRVKMWLEAVLSNAQGFEAKEDKDLIFALQNIAQPEDAVHRLLFPKIDYQIPTQELFEQFIKRLVSLNENNCIGLTPISIFEDRTDFQLTCLPSWVPDWRKSKTRLVNKHSNYCLTHGHKLDLSQPGVLLLDGVLLGTVDDAWPMDDYYNSLSTSLGKDNKTFALAHYNMYRSNASSLCCEYIFNQMPMISHGLEEIRYRPYKYTIEAVAPFDTQRRPYVLASEIVQPGDLLVSFTLGSVILTKFGYEPRAWCSVLRKYSGNPHKYHFLGPCIFEYMEWREPGISEYRRSPVDTKKYALI